MIGYNPPQSYGSNQGGGSNDSDIQSLIVKIIQDYMNRNGTNASTGNSFFGSRQNNLFKPTPLSGAADVGDRGVGMLTGLMNRSGTLTPKNDSQNIFYGGMPKIEKLGMDGLKNSTAAMHMLDRNDPRLQEAIRNIKYDPSVSIKL